MILAAATVLTGLVAGLFQAFSYAVMPGLRRTDDATFVRTMRAINAAILNPWFLALFVGGPVLTVAAGVVVFVDSAGLVLVWVTVGLVCSLLTLGVTGRVNVPLNERLHADPIETHEQQRAARAAFERAWVRSNHIRSVASTAAAVALVIALSLR